MGAAIDSNANRRDGNGNIPTDLDALTLPPPINPLEGLLRRLEQREPGFGKKLVAAFEDPPPVANTKLEE